MFRIWAVIAALIVYGSLYPWKSDRIARRPGFALSRPSRTDVRDAIFNIAIYVPLGAASYLALRTRMGRLGALTAAAISATAVSAAVEAAQQWQPGRMSSLYDIAANGFGAAAGAAATMIGLRTVRDSWPGPKVPDARALALVACWAAYITFPFVPSISADKIAGKAEAFWAWPAYSSVRAVMAAAIWFAGAVALHHARVRPLRPWLLASVVAVPAQVLISRREPLLVDAAGAVAGVLLYLALHASRKIRLAGMLCVAMIALRGVLPHDSSYHQAFEWTPFRPVLEGDWHTGALAMLAKTILYGSCSWLLHRDGVFSERQAICATVLFLIGLEVLQTGISGRTPESTDPVVALLAGICLHGIPAWNAASTNEPRA